MFKLKLFKFNLFKFKKKESKKAFAPSTTSPDVLIADQTSENTNFILCAYGTYCTLEFQITGTGVKFNKRGVQIMSEGSKNFETLISGWAIIWYSRVMVIAV